MKLAQLKRSFEADKVQLNRMTNSGSESQDTRTQYTHRIQQRELLFQFITQNPGRWACFRNAQNEGQAGPSMVNNMM